jgi:hypothetical protein
MCSRWRTSALRSRSMTRIEVAVNRRARKERQRLDREPVPGRDTPRHHSDDQICPTLGPSERCLRVMQYRDGRFEDIHHQHVPASRLSVGVETEVLRALVSSAGAWPPDWQVTSRLNARRGGPSVYPRFTIVVGHPEPGVLRRYCSSGDVTAWCDSVVAPHVFRTDVAGRHRD